MVELTDRATENIKYASHMSHDLGAVTIFRFSELGSAFWRFMTQTLPVIFRQLSTNTDIKIALKIKNS